MTLSTGRLGLLNITRYKLFLGLILYSILPLLVAGCPSNKARDNLPPGVPKGFIKFYTVKSRGDAGIRPRIYCIDKDKVKYEGLAPVPGKKTAEAGLLIAKSPGRYRFSVRINQGISRDIYIRILENMIIPVEIRYSDVRERGKETFFNMDLYIDDPVSLER